MPIKLNINSKNIKVKPKIGLCHIYDFAGRKMYGLTISLYCNEQPHAKGYLDPFTKQIRAGAQKPLLSHLL